MLARFGFCDKGVDSLLVDPWRFVTDGSDIYLSVLKERYPHAKHVVCFFHQLRTISRWEKRLEKENNRYKKMKILRHIIARFNEIPFHMGWMGTLSTISKL